MTVLAANETGFLTSVMSFLKGQDIALFTKINTEWTSGFADLLFPILRDQRTWYPLYALLLVYLIWKFRWKALPFMITAAITAAIADQISSNFLKAFFGRIRPCHEELLTGIMIHRVGYCPNSGSFTSSHAVNHFALAVLIIVALKPYFKNWRYLFLPWAAAICYAQVYVGVHYPGDVLGGALLGTGIGALMAFLFKRYFNFGMPTREGRKSNAAGT